MNNFSSNIKLLRKRRGRTQDEVAFLLGMKRPTLSGYENNVASPGLEVLSQFSKYFNVSIDTLIKVDLSSLPESQLSQLERGLDIFMTGGNIRVLATTVDAGNEENIEMVSEKAKAGYRTGFADPEFIKVLPTFQMPFLSRQKKYRSFQISGDSMLPIPHGSWVVCEFVQDWTLIQDKYAYIINTIEDGVVFKVAENLLKTQGKLRLHSLNPAYPPYEVNVSDIREVWKFVNYISSELPPQNTPLDEMALRFQKMERDIQQLKSKVARSTVTGTTGRLFE